jgi:hypothetical protein
MPTVKRVENQIANLEGFDVAFTQFDRDIRGDKDGLPGFARHYDKAASGNITVERWKVTRFRPHYPGYDVDVLYSDGRVAQGNTLLRTIRESYAEQDG